MTDTIRTALYLQNALRDDQPDGAIVPQVIRDLVVSVMSAVVGVVAAGTSQSDAAVLSAQMNVITSVPTGTGVMLIAGLRTVIMHRGANTLTVYPPPGGQLESLGTNIGFSLQPGTDATVLFDPVNTSHGYVSIAINLASLPTTLPATAGLLWNNGGMLSVS